MVNLTPLDILNKRTLTTLPPHFSTIKVEKCDLQTERWIKINLKGRYCVSKLLDNNVFKFNEVIGFEDPRELTYFILSCPYIRRN